MMPNATDETIGTIEVNIANITSVSGLIEEGKTLEAVSYTHLEADYVVIIDDGKISAEGTPLELKNIYTGDYITIYGVDEKDIKALNIEYEQIRNGYRLSVPNTKAATELIIRNPQLFNDYEDVYKRQDHWG